MPFKNARLWTGTMPNSPNPKVLYKVYLTGDANVNGVRRHSWSQIFRFPAMLSTLKPTQAFLTRGEAARNALMLFPSEESFKDYVVLRESKHGLELDQDTKRRLNLEEVTWGNADRETVLETTELAVDEIDELQIAPEGRAFFASHRLLERNSAMRRAVVAQKGRSCEICSMSFRDTYGAEFGQFVEVHHLVGLSEGERMSQVSDFAVLCANCHRAVHYGQSHPRTLEAVRSMLKSMANRQTKL